MELTYRFAIEPDIPRLIVINSGLEAGYLDINENLFDSLVVEKRILCALQGEAIIGILQFERVFLGRPNLWYFEQLTVDKEYRRHRVGLSLLENGLRIAKAENAERAFADIHIENEASLAMCLAAKGIRSGSIEGVDGTGKDDVRVIVRFEL